MNWKKLYECKRKGDKVKVGDTVLIRKKLISGHSYGSRYIAVSGMLKYREKTGKVVKIENGIYRLNIDNGEFIWTNEMLEER